MILFYYITFKKFWLKMAALQSILYITQGCRAKMTKQPTLWDSLRSCLVPCPSWILRGPYNNTSITNFQVGQWWRKEKTHSAIKSEWNTETLTAVYIIYIGFTKLSSDGCWSDFWIIPFKMIDLFFRGPE